MPDALRKHLINTETVLSGHVLKGPSLNIMTDWVKS